jgi:hypothetical protein
VKGAKLPETRRTFMKIEQAKQITGKAIEEKSKNSVMPWKRATVRG